MTSVPNRRYAVGEPLLYGFLRKYSRGHKNICKFELLLI